MIRRELPLLLLGFALAGPGRADAQDASAWRFESQRPEIAPVHRLDAEVRDGGGATLALAGGGKEFADGRWTRSVPVEAGAHYRFRSRFQTSDVEEPRRSVLARLLWLDARGEQLGNTEYPATLRARGADGWDTIDETYRAPDSAAEARLELVYRWDADGAVHFTPAALEQVEAPAPRMVGLATVHYRPRNDRTLSENLEHFGRLIAEAAERGADLVVLPEGINLAGTGRSYVEASEPLDGATVRFLAEVARRYRVYLVAGILERDGDVVYNTAVLLDRDGRTAGSYRKVSLPREEIDGGVTPGDAFPTFEADFGRIGIMICWDVTFPEAARALAMDGAEVILMPIWGGNTTLARARAIENQVYLVSSSYDMESGIFDLEGELAAEATEEEPVAVLEVDLGKKKDWPWLGDLKNRIPREMPPARSTAAATSMASGR
jgi:predicted amidohydrolase